MVQAAAGGFDEKQINLFLEQYASRADLVYRLGTMLTLSFEGAEKLTDKAFKLLSEDFDQASKTTNPVLLLMALAWQAYLKIKNETFKAADSRFLKMLKPLSLEQRAVLYGVDVLGLDIGEVAKIFGSDEIKVRQLLAQGRQGLTKINWHGG